MIVKEGIKINKDYNSYIIDRMNMISEKLDTNIMLLSEMDGRTYKVNKVTGKNVDLNVKEERLYFMKHGEMFKDDWGFKFVTRHMERRKYSDIEHWLLTNNVTIWTEVLEVFRVMLDFKDWVIMVYITDLKQENSKEQLYYDFYNAKMEKPSLKYTFGDLKWMSSQYFEFKDIEGFLKRFYEIIENEDERKEFIETINEYIVLKNEVKKNIESEIERSNVIEEKLEWILNKYKL